MNRIFSVNGNSWQMISSGFKGSLMMDIKERDLKKASVIEHNCIKSNCEIR